MTVRETTSDPMVAVCVLTWNGAARTIRCIVSVTRSAYANWRLVVMDNGSDAQDYGTLLKGLQEIGLMPGRTVGKDSPGTSTVYDNDRVAVLRSGANLGFTGGHNTTIAMAQKKWAPDYLFLLNNDAELDTEALGKCVHVAQTSGAGIVGVTTLTKDTGRCHFTGADSYMELYVRIPVRDLARLPDVWDTLHADGSAMLIGSGVLRSVVDRYGEAFDPRLFVYGEDAELCYRARQLGFRVVMTKVPRIYHEVAGSSGGYGNTIQRYYITRNRVWLGERWLHGPHRFFFRFYYPLSRAGRSMLLVLRGQWRLALAVLEGLRDAYAHRTGPWRKHG